MPPQSQELEERKVQFIFSDGVSRLYRRILKLLKIISLLLPRLLKCIVNSCLLFGFSCRMRSLRSNCRGGSEGAVPRLIPLLPSLPHCVTATIFRDSAFRRSHWDPHGAERERERKRERERERERKREREREREKERGGTKSRKTGTGGGIEETVSALFPLETESVEKSIHTQTVKSHRKVASSVAAECTQAHEPSLTDAFFLNAFFLWNNEAVVNLCDL
jgi:hypothetical protein